MLNPITNLVESAEMQNFQTQSYCDQFNLCTCSLCCLVLALWS